MNIPLDVIERETGLPLDNREYPQDVITDFTAGAEWAVAEERRTRGDEPFYSLLADAWDAGWDARQRAVLAYMGGAYHDPDYAPDENPYRKGGD